MRAFPLHFPIKKVKVAASPEARHHPEEKTMSLVNKALTFKVYKSAH